MLRRLHSLPGLVAGLLVIVMAITGAVLALQPAIEHFQIVNAKPEVTVAALAEAVSTHVADVQRIVRTASGSIIAYTGGGKAAAASLVDPNTGAVLGAYEPSAFFTFFTELHRSLFLGANGRVVAGLGALAIAILAASGIFLLAKRLGGWSRLLTPTKGTVPQRLHTELARMAVVALVVTGLTGSYMSLATFGLLPDGSAAESAYPSSADGSPLDIGALAALKDTPVSALRELTFPDPTDPTDVYTLVAASGQGYVDQTNGELLGFVPNTLGQQIYETFYMLHTGQGLWWFGIVLGFAALAVPALSVTGTVIWWRRRKNQPRIQHNVGGRHAEIVLLVGSEGNSTWGFATALHDALTRAGQKVHTAPMNDLAASYPAARHLLVLTATYGDGTAPASADRFLARLPRLKAGPDLTYAVLGFGDRSFAHYCQFARDVDAALGQHGLGRFIALNEVDRMSSQTFSGWARELSAAIGAPFSVEHVPARPRSSQFELVGRVDYGMEVQAPTAVLRFAAPDADDRRPWWALGPAKGLPSFQAGDLVGIIPPGSRSPRYYSLASGSKEGVLEICVRKQTGGLCSEFLHGLEPGGVIDAFVKPNPSFRPRRGKSPMILIGAGTGIAPLAGFVWNNHHHRPIHLYFGGRDPASDFLYAPMLDQALSDHRLTRLVTTFSRIVGGGYVQDKVRQDGPTLRDLIAHGAQVMVCGGRQMADGVSDSIDACLAPLGETVATLKAKGRYLEDVY